MQLLVAIDALDDLVHSGKRVPLTDQVRVDATALNRAVERLRRGINAQFGRVSRDDPEVSSIRRLVAELEGVAADARPVPLTPEVRVGHDDVSGRLHELRTLVPQAVAKVTGSDDDPGPSTAVWEAIDAIDDTLHYARTVPLTSQVRVDAGKLTQLVTRLRQRLGHLPSYSPAHAALGAIEAMIAGAKRVPLTNQVRVSRDALLARLDELREAVVETPMSS